MRVETVINMNSEKRQPIKTDGVIVLGLEETYDGHIGSICMAGKINTRVAIKTMVRAAKDLEGGEDLLIDEVSKLLKKRVEESFEELAEHDIEKFIKMMRSR